MVKVLELLKGWNSVLGQREQNHFIKGDRASDRHSRVESDKLVDVVVGRGGYYLLRVLIFSIK